MSSFFNILFTSRKIDRLLKHTKNGYLQIAARIMRVLFAAGRLKKFCIHSFEMEGKNLLNFIFT